MTPYVGKIEPVNHTVGKRGKALGTCPQKISIGTYDRQRSGICNLLIALKKECGDIITYYWHQAMYVNSRLDSG